MPLCLAVCAIQPCLNVAALGLPGMPTGNGKHRCEPWLTVQPEASFRINRTWTKPRALSKPSDDTSLSPFTQQTESASPQQTPRMPRERNDSRLIQSPGTGKDRQTEQRHLCEERGGVWNFWEWGRGPHSDRTPRHMRVCTDKTVCSRCVTLHLHFTSEKNL